MSEDVKVTKISVQIGSKKIDLSVEDAKKLKDVLEDIFGKNTDVTIIEKEVYRDWQLPYITWNPIYCTGDKINYSYKDDTLCCT